MYLEISTETTACPPMAAWCENFSSPVNRWSIRSQPASRAPSIARATRDTAFEQWPRSKLKVLFVPVFGLFSVSVTHRCPDAAEYIGRPWHACDDPRLRSIAHEFDAFVHCKIPCQWLLSDPTTSGKLHMLDHIDAYRNLGASAVTAGRFGGEIFNTLEQRDAFCSTAVCVVIPHHFNLLEKLGRCAGGSCVGRLTEPMGPNVGCGGGEVTTRREGGGGGRGGEARWRAPLSPSARSVGIISSRSDGKLAANLQMWNESVQIEPRYATKPPAAEHAAPVATDEWRAATCRFYQSIDVAVAWKAFKRQGQDAPHRYDILYKPAERYTNAVMLGLPTIAYAGYRSQAALSPPPLQCLTEKCVHDTVRQIRAGSLKHAVRAQAECVGMHLARPELASFYELLWDVGRRVMHADARNHALPTTSTTE